MLSFHSDAFYVTTCITKEEQKTNKSVPRKQQKCTCVIFFYTSCTLTHTLRMILHTNVCITIHPCVTAPFCWQYWPLNNDWTLLVKFHTTFVPTHTHSYGIETVADVNGQWGLIWLGGIRVGAKWWNQITIMCSEMKYKK